MSHPPSSGLRRRSRSIPTVPRPIFAWACLLEGMSRVDDAMAEYFRALEFDPNNPEISLRIATIQLARNQPDQALSRLDQVVELAAENGEARDLRGRAHLTLRHFPQAIEDFRAAASRLPNRPDIHYHLALALEADQKPADALREAEQALRLRPQLSRRPRTHRTPAPLSLHDDAFTGSLLRRQGCDVTSTAKPGNSFEVACSPRLKTRRGRRRSIHRASVR